MLALLRFSIFNQDDFLLDDLFIVFICGVNNTEFLVCFCFLLKRIDIIDINAQGGS